MSKLLEKAKEFWDKGRSFIAPDGSEVPDPRPVEMPIGFERPESIQDMIRRLVTDPALRAGLTANELETFDEADDFEVDDDFPQSPHEDQFDPEHLLSREQEVMAGAVRPRTAEEVAAARKVLADHKAALDAALRDKAKLPPASVGAAGEKGA